MRLRDRALAALGVLALAAPARANPTVSAMAELDTAEEPGQKSVEVIGEVAYSYDLQESTIVRERIGDPAADPLQPIPTIRDLEFKQFRHVITPRLQLSVYRSTFLSVALPITINQVRELSLAPGVDRAGSTTIAEGLVPASGFDARDPGTTTPGDLVFRGPNRKGLDQVHLGLGTTPMNQDTDPTKPTWKLGAELRLAIGKVMRFDPMAPRANTAVSEGTQEVRLWTSFTKRVGWAAPWIDMFWMVPLTGKSSSLYDDPGFGASNTLKSQQAGVGFGLELYAIDKPADQTRISLDLGTRAVATFEGRQYTEMWEIFALAGDSRGTGPLILDADPTRSGVQPLSHPGISNVENHLAMTARFALRAQIGPHVKFAVIGDLIWETDHAITFADAGVDREDDGDLVNPGTDEVNPVHVPSIDLVGHRYRSENNFDLVLGVQGQVMF